MNQKRYENGQIICVLKRVEESGKNPDVIRQMGLREGRFVTGREVFLDGRHGTGKG